ncbi:MAG: hypothetical protein IJ087_19300 [Eggerthellaceae bacterium]|nr:hypothetical protein [Eggerthellaceae bacterium]
MERAIKAHFERHRLEQVVGVLDSWPQRIALGNPTRADLSADAVEISRIVEELLDWERAAPVELVFKRRMIGGALHDIPTHVLVEAIDDSARLCGRAAERSLRRARERAELLCGRLGTSGDVLFRVLKATDGYDDVDFSLLVEASCWFRDNDATGLTPRQVPLPGFSAKWIDSQARRDIVQALCGRQLDLKERARSVEYAYLDPDYLVSGARRYDSYVEGDALTLPYDPDFVVIVENKDTFRSFPPRAGGVCLFGSGWAGTALIPDLPWIRSASPCYYWGDIDADGFEILNAYRAAGLAVESLLMDMATYEMYERFGTDFATGATSLATRREKPLEFLTEQERAVYRMLVARECPGHRRIEQERIPYSALPFVSVAC